MWEQLARYRNHFLQHEIKDVMKPTSINSLQTTGNLVAIYNQRRIIIKKMDYRVDASYGETEYLQVYAALLQFDLNAPGGSC